MLVASIGCSGTPSEGGTTSQDDTALDTDEALAVADCSTPEKVQARLNALLRSPIKLGLTHSKMGGLTRHSTKLKAEAANCPAFQHEVGTYDVLSWGEKQAFSAYYVAGADFILFYRATDGYRGTMTLKSRDGQHTYEVGIGKLLKDGAPFKVRWHTSFESADLGELEDAVWVAQFGDDGKHDETCRQCKIYREDPPHMLKAEFSRDGNGQLDITFDDRTSLPTVIDVVTSPMRR
jgi:hypothetical protein